MLAVLPAENAGDFSMLGSGCCILTVLRTNLLRFQKREDEHERYRWTTPRGVACAPVTAPQRVCVSMHAVTLRLMVA